MSCGEGPQTRKRRCLDELRGEMKTRSPCEGRHEDAEMRKCDLGPCEIGKFVSDLENSTTEKSFRKKFTRKRRRRRRRRKNSRRRGRRGRRQRN